MFTHVANDEEQVEVRAVEEVGLAAEGVERADVEREGLNGADGAVGGGFADPVEVAEREMALNVGADRLVVGVGRQSLEGNADALA